VNSIGVMYAREVVFSCVEYAVRNSTRRIECVVIPFPTATLITRGSPRAHLQIKDALGVESPRGTELRTRMVTNTAGETLRNNMRH